MLSKTNSRYLRYLYFLGILFLVSIMYWIVVMGDKASFSTIQLEAKVYREVTWYATRHGRYPMALTELSPDYADLDTVAYESNGWMYYFIYIPEPFSPKRFPLMELASVKHERGLSGVRKHVLQQMRGLEQATSWIAFDLHAKGENEASLSRVDPGKNSRRFWFADEEW